MPGRGGARSADGRSSQAATPAALAKAKTSRSCGRIHNQGSTTIFLRAICPGRNMMRYPPIHAKTDFDGRFRDTLENCGRIDQLDELYDKNDGADLGMSENILNCTIHRDRIYQIKTQIT